MRAYATEINQAHYYFKAGGLYLTHEPGSTCLLSPGDIVWKTDIDTLRLLEKRLQTAVSLGSVAAKYLINTEREIE